MKVKRLALVLIPAALLALPATAYGYWTRSSNAGWVEQHGGCGEGPTRQGVTESSHGASYKFPYGNVLSCRELAFEGRFPGSVDASVYLLLETDKGLVALRADYRDIQGGRQYSVKAAELGADNVPGELTDAETARLRTDIASRGGLNSQEWTLNYGDG